MSSATITANAGPGLPNTNLVLNGVRSLHFNIVGKVLQVDLEGQIKEFDLSIVDSITFSVSGSTYTVTVTQLS